MCLYASNHHHQAQLKLYETNTKPPPSPPPPPTHRPPHKRLRTRRREDKLCGASRSPLARKATGCGSDAAAATEHRPEHAKVKHRRRTGSTVRVKSFLSLFLRSLSVSLPLAPAEERSQIRAARQRVGQGVFRTFNKLADSHHRTTKSHFSVFSQQPAALLLHRSSPVTTASQPIESLARSLAARPDRPDKRYQAQPG
jgi:hypothetical protein